MAEILILIMLWVLTNAFSCIAGIFISKRLEYRPRVRERPEVTEAQQREADKARTEWRNMLTYDGEEQK